MSNIVDLEKLSHRSKDRIKDLGEVFTPEAYVEDMLNLLAKEKRGLWSDEDISFFEPCCGHGNIVLAIYRKRLEGIYKKSLSHGNSEAAYYAVANALNTLWAIDIDSKNVENCRSRVLFATLEFLKEKTNVKNNHTLIAKKNDFFVHIVSAIKWHISENETLSALSTSEASKTKANLTKAGTKWFSKNGHKELDFDLTWTNYFESCESSKVVPLEYKKAVKFMECVSTGKLKYTQDFEFAKVAIYTDEAAYKSSRSQRVSA